MDDLIHVINKLQDVFATVGARQDIKLPQIVVVGSQSAGKSSVLESIVGRSFLPRGTGTVTRCPLILQLIYAPFDDSKYRSAENGTTSIEEWCQFLHNPTKIFTDFHEVRTEIEQETKRLAGDNKGIRSDPINLKVYSPRLVNLTLVDLPGMVKVPTGDQPEDIETQINDLIRSYITNPNSIILAVSPANNDMATSESIKIAQEKDIDPNGDRTLVVVTKLDLMDEGTDASRELSGAVIPVKLGIIGVVNRSQLSTEKNKSMEQQMKDEALFLKKNYPSLASTNGTPFLTKNLNNLLMNHIRDCIPELSKRLNGLISERKVELELYGPKVKDEDKQLVLLELIKTFDSNFHSALKGIAKSGDLCAGAKICYILHDVLDEKLKSIDPSDGLEEDEILCVIRNATGVDTPIFVPEEAFRILVKMQLKALQEPILSCVALVYEEMQQIVRHCGSETVGLGRFPRLHEKIMREVLEILSDRLERIEDKLKELIDVELDYINTKHPDFRQDVFTMFENKRMGRKTNSSANPSLQHQSGDSNDKYPEHETLTDEERADVVKNLIASYFDIVRKTILDTGAKRIMFHLVNDVGKHLHSQLVLRLFTGPEAVAKLLTESLDFSEKRKNAEEMLKALRKAEKIISEFVGSGHNAQLPPRGEMATADSCSSLQKENLSAHVRTSSAVNLSRQLTFQNRRPPPPPPSAGKKTPRALEKTSPSSPSSPMPFV